MKNIFAKSRLICVSFLVCILLGTLNICADASQKAPAFTLSGEAITAGDELHLKIYAQNNPGLICTKLGLYYNRDYFSVVSSSDLQEVFSPGFFASSGPETYPYLLVWISINETQNDGALGEIVLKCEETTPAGEYDFYIDYSPSDTCNEEGVEVEFERGSVSVQVTAKEGVEPKYVENPAPVFIENDGFKPIGSFDNFSKKNTYDQTVFADVNSDEWYYKDVADAYEYGIISEGEPFCAEDSLTLAQGITLASRINDIYFGGNGTLKIKNPEHWYTVYVNYAKKKNIYSAEVFGEDFERSITRKEFALLMAKALPVEGYEKINNVTTLPDLEKDDKSFEAVLLLYNAGILTGNNENLSFAPDKPIKRSEAAAMVNRLAVKQNRKQLP